MNLNLKSFRQLIEDMGAALQGSATSLVDVSVGSVIRAIFEANASVVLWLQWLVLQTLSMTRAATSTDSDLDSWMADFGVTRLSAIPATGVTTFTRYAANQSASVPIGTIVKTADGFLSFAVTEDDSISIWQKTLSGYVLPIGVAAADLPVACLSSGSAGNVLSGTVITIASSVPGIDQVTNANGFTNGVDSEDDKALRARFQTFMASRSRATLTAVRTAVSNVRQGLIFNIAENINLDGSERTGSFLVIVDDGSGYPSADLLAAVASAVEFVRPIGTAFVVIPPPVISANVSITVYLDATETADALSATIKQQIIKYLNALPIGYAASVTRLAMCGYKASGAVRNITSVLVNGLPVDLAPPPRSVIKAGEVTVILNVG